MRVLRKKGEVSLVASRVLTTSLVPTHHALSASRDGALQLLDTQS